ncbi:MAG: hypothetical protein PUB09_05240 [Firmicutes bacterium]|nr:hypothetical protein [Bacillota bacterium]
MEKNVLFNCILNSYQENYDIIRFAEENTGGPALFAKATMHLRESGYIMSRKAEMWSANSDEHVWFYDADNPSEEQLKSIVDGLYEKSLTEIDLSGNHMCTRVVAFFICQNLDEGARNYIKKCKLRKDFMFSLKGWLEVHVVAICLESQEAIGNKAAKETVEFADNILHPKKTKSSLLFNIGKRVLK